MNAPLSPAQLSQFLQDGYVRSKGRALLMLFLFSDVGELDAPTLVRVGSHRDVARLLQPAGEAGLSFMELAGKLAALPARPEVAATEA